MTPADIKTIIQEQLPIIIAEDATIRDFILRTVSEYYSPKQETESKFDEFTVRFDRILAELQQDREEQARKWDEYTREQNRKWDENNRKWEENNRKWDEYNREQNLKWEENNRKWDEYTHEQNEKWEENNRKWDEYTHEQNEKWEKQNEKWEKQNQEWWEQNERNKETLAEIKLLRQKYDSTIGALGSRWGLYSEASFRNALKGILEDSFGVEVLNINDFDSEGMVFGNPDQVEIDVIIKNGLVIVCEIKSSISKSDMYIFNRKVEFYQQRYHRHVNRKIVISPMVNSTALPVAENLGIEVYSYAEDVPVEN